MGSAAPAWMHIYDSLDDGKTSRIVIFWRGVWLPVSVPHILKSQQNSPLLRHIKGKMTRGWWLPACQSDKACLALFVPLQGQFALCDLSKGNVIWQVLLTSEEHLRVSGDIGHPYSVAVCSFVIFKGGIPLMFFFFFSQINIWCMWRFLMAGNCISNLIGFKKCFLKRQNRMK